MVETRRAKRRRTRRSPTNDDVTTGPRAGGPPTGASGQSGTAGVPSFASAAKKPPRKPLVVGTLRSPPPPSLTGISGQAAAAAGTVGGKRLTAAKPLYGKAMFCVDNVSNDVTVDDLQQFVRRMGVRVIECNTTNPRRTRRQKANDIIPDDHRAFFLCINKANIKLLLDPSKWPADVSVSAWFFKKKDGTQQTTTTTNAAASTAATSAVASQPSSVTASQSSSAAATQQATVETNVAVAANTVTVSVDVLHSADGGSDVVSEPMSLSPIVSNIAAAAANDHSDVCDEASDTLHDDAHNSTAVQIVDLSTIIDNH